MKHNESEWITEDGFKLYWQEWKPETEQLCGIVLLIHGLGEHSGRYTHVAEAFTNSGYLLFAFDQRGHGQSEGIRGDETFELTCKDIDHFLDKIRNQYPELPIFLYGHSLGGLLVLYYTTTHHPDISGVISSAPALSAEKGVSGTTIFLAKFLSRVTPKMQINNGLDRNALSRIPEVVEKYNTDPLVHGKISTRFGLELIQKSKWMQEQTEFPLPLLLIAGNADRIIDPVAVQQFGSRLNGNITMKMMDGFYHEVHNEPNSQEVIQGMIQWLDDIVVKA